MDPDSLDQKSATACAPIPSLVPILAGLALFTVAVWIGTKLESLTAADYEQHLAAILAAGVAFLATGVAGICLLGFGLGNAVRP